LKSGQSLDYEAAATVPVTLTFTDAGGETYEEQFTIHVTDVNEAPTAVHLASTTVAENSAGATIGTVSVTDPDQSNTPFGTHSFEVLEDYGSGFVTSTRFEVAANQLRLKSGIALDHETAASVVVRIRATDGGTASIEDEFSITVTD